MATDELDILADTTDDATGLEDTTADSFDQAQSTILEDFYGQQGQTITGPRGREVPVTEDMLRQQLQSELIASQNFDYVPYGSIDPDDYETDQYGNVIVRVDETFGPQAASGDALGFSFSDKDAANKLFGGQVDQVESVIRDYNSQIYAITSGAAELGLTLPEADQQRLRQQAQEMYPNASEAELQYVYKELVKDELGIDDFQAEKVRLSEERNNALAEYGLDIATMGERAGPQQTLAGTYELDQGQTTYTINATTGEITTYTKPTTGVIAKGIFTAALSAGLTAGLAGPLTAALKGAGLSSSLATAASQAIINGATQLVTTGDLDIKQALISGAIAYGGAELGEFLQNTSELDGVLGDITSTAQDTVSKFQELVETNIPIADAAIQAGGMSMLTQLVSTGDIDLKEAAVAAVIGGGIEAFNQFNTNMNALGVPEDEYMADLAEYEEFQQAAINADIKDPFLNPNYTTVGDGVMVNAAGDVFNYAGDNLGNMSTLDTNNDGKLSGVDLQEIEVTATKVSVYDNLDPTLRHYVDADGNIRTDVSGISRETGGIVASDGTELFQAKYDNGKLLVADETGAFNTIRNNDGSIYGTYNAETGEWVDAEGKTLDSSVGEYMATKSGVFGASQTDTGMTKTEYEQLSGPELFDDYFVQRGGDGQLALGDTEMQELVDRFGSGEAFEEWLQNPDPDNPGVGYGVNYSSGTGYVFESGVDTSEGIYGFMGNDSTISSLFEADELSDTQFSIFDLDYVDTTKKQVDPPWAEPEPVDPTEVTEVTKTDPAGGVETADNTADAISTATNTNQVNEIVTAASQQGASASQLTNAINAAVAAGTISAEQAAAALGAIDVTASVDPSTTSVSTGAGGMLTGGAGADVDTVTTGDVTTGSGAGTDVTGGGNGTDVTGGGDSGVTTGGGGDVDTGTDTGTATGSSITDAITGALGGAIATVAGTGDPGTGDPGTGDPGTGGPGTGGPPGIDGKDGKDGRDGGSSRPFTPYEFKGFSYQTPTIQEIVQNPNIDYSASLDRIINQGMFKDYV